MPEVVYHHCASLRRTRASKASRASSIYDRACKLLRRVWTIDRRAGCDSSQTERLDTSRWNYGIVVHLVRRRTSPPRARLASNHSRTQRAVAHADAARHARAPARASFQIPTVVGAASQALRPRQGRFVAGTRRIVAPVQRSRHRRTPETHRFAQLRNKFRGKCPLAARRRPLDALSPSGRSVAIGAVGCRTEA